jgi:hypothetical protein
MTSMLQRTSNNAGFSTHAFKLSGSRKVSDNYNSMSPSLQIQPLFFIQWLVGNMNILSSRTRHVVLSLSLSHSCMEFFFKGQELDEGAQKKKQTIL